MSNWSHETTDDPVYADRRNFYKVERWTKDGGLHVSELLYAGNDLEKDREIFAAEKKFRPRPALHHPPGSSWSSMAAPAPAMQHRLPVSGNEIHDALALSQAS